MKSLLFACAVALVAFFWLGASAFASSSPVDGSPVSLNSGPIGGYFIWHDSGGFHLRTTDPEGVESHFTGVITTDGRFHDVTPIRAERDDHVSTVGDGMIVFDLHTYSGIDGFDFQVAGENSVTFDLRRDGHRISTDHIYLGQHGVHPRTNPFVIYR